MKSRLLCTALSLIGVGAAMSAANAAEARLSLSLPEIQGSRVKRPYVAVWLEKAGSGDFAANIAVWYDMRKPNNIGATKWLPDLRAWWRASGSQASFPIDGVSGATRPAGEHLIDLGAAPAMKQLPAGNYDLVVEVAREHGGHDLLRLPMQWPPQTATTRAGSGTTELGTVGLMLKP